MKKIATILAALAGLTGLSAFAQQSASTFAVTTDFTYTSQYVFRGLQRIKGDAFTPSVEATLGNARRSGYLGLWTMQPITKNQDNEIDIYAGYKQSLTRVLSVEAVGTCYWYPEASGGATKNSYELGAKLTYAARGITASACAYYDFRLRSTTGVGLVGYSFPIPKLGTSIDVGFQVGAAGFRNMFPDAGGPKVRDSYVYYGFDFNVPWHISERAIVTAGLHYSNNHNTPIGTPDNKLWFSLGLATRF